MRETILNLHNSLEDGFFISFISNVDQFPVRKNDEIEFLDEKTLLIHRESGNELIINLNLIVGICTRKEWI